MLSAWAGMGNLGDDWILSVAIDRLAPGREIGLLLEPNASPPSDAVGHSILRWPILSPRQSTIYGAAAFTETLREWDGVLFCGGGWLADDMGLRAPSRWTWRMQLLTGVPAYAYGIGVGPFSSSLGAVLGRRILDRLKILGVRSQEDAECVRRLTSQSVRVVGDATFAAELEGHVPNSRGVVVAMPRPHAHWLPRARWSDYVSAVTRAARQLAEGEQVVFIAFDRDDAGFWADVAKVVEPAGYRSGIAAVASARVALAGRFHAATAAALTGVPAVTVAYHHKFDSLRSLGVAPISIASFVSYDTTPVPVLPDQVSRVRRWSEDAWSRLVLSEL